MSIDALNQDLRDVVTDIAGLDVILSGGLTADRVYLVEGDPGAGKTTLALQFLLAGVRRREKGLYVTLSETKDELEAAANSHGWNLDGINICELIASEESLKPDSQVSMFHPSEVELAETTRTVLEEVERLKPSRVVFDSLSELRLLAQNPLRYRRQILALKQFFLGRHCTVLLLDDRTSQLVDLQLQSIASGVLMLEHLAPEFGAERRRLRVIKMRGKTFRGGYHDFVIRKGGLQVFPRLVAAEHHENFADQQIKSGSTELDKLVGGGLDMGTSTLLMGPAGCGKSTIATQYAVAAAQRGDKAAIFTFDESIRTLIKRSTGMNIPVQQQLEKGTLTIQQIDPAELSPGEFAHAVRGAIEGGVKLLVIDSLNGYLNAMPEERFLITQLHELLTFLGQKGVTTIMVMAQHGLMGREMASPVDASYLADSVVLLRYFESEGMVRQAISVLKKRSGQHERAIRELKMSAAGLAVGPPLRNFSGVLTGVPTLIASQVGEGDASR